MDLTTAIGSVSAASASRAPPGSTPGCLSSERAARPPRHRRAGTAVRRPLVERRPGRARHAVRRRLRGGQGAGRRSRPRISPERSSTRLRERCSSRADRVGDGDPHACRRRPRSTRPRDRSTPRARGSFGRDRHYGGPGATVLRRGRGSASSPGSRLRSRSSPSALVGHRCCSTARRAAVAAAAVRRAEVGDPGFEPGTSALSERRSNRLS